MMMYQYKKKDEKKKSRRYMAEMPIIQRFPDMSRSLKHEKQDMDKRIEGIREEAGLMDVRSDFDDDYMETMGEYFRLKENHQIMHHILPQKAIRSFISQLDGEERREVLARFMRYEPGAGGKNDITDEEYRQITNGEAPDQVIDTMLKRTLVSLRSNLTVGPGGRADDPKQGMDPNYRNGEPDEISGYYLEAHKLIRELEGLNGGNRRKRQLIIAMVQDKFKAAERNLARRQGKTGSRSYLETELEPYDSTKWTTGLNDQPVKRKS